ncbi:hypothetical protein F4781DRAFT_407659 [Annulohypoxylon bovei var. microspora]|nr:hypothetical protein F4781DRAFT_407659 [Annulohypoxylon bovei var. microspora]
MAVSGRSGVPCPYVSQTTCPKIRHRLLQFSFRILGESSFLALSISRIERTRSSGTQNRQDSHLCGQDFPFLHLILSPSRGKVVAISIHLAVTSGGHGIPRAPAIYQGGLTKVNGMARIPMTYVQPRESWAEPPLRGIRFCETSANGDRYLIEAPDEVDKDGLFRVRGEVEFSGMGCTLHLYKQYPSSVQEMRGSLTLLGICGGIFLTGLR